MVFGDDDLKRLKAMLAGKVVTEMPSDYWLALLARLEAAEDRVRDLEDVIRRMARIAVPHSDCAEKIEAEINAIVSEWERRSSKRGKVYCKP